MKTLWNIFSPSPGNVSGQSTQNILFASGFVLFLIAGQDVADAQPGSRKHQEWKFDQNSRQQILETSAEEFAAWSASIVLKTEYGESKPAVRRWRRAPTVGIVGGSESQRKVVENSVKLINEVLARTRYGGLKILNEDTETKGRDQNEKQNGKSDSIRTSLTADMVVFLGPFEQLAKVAEAKGFQMAEGNHAFFALKWDAEFRITEATVLVSTDYFNGKRLEHVVLEEMIQALGPTNDSSKFKNSVFYSGSEGPRELNWRDQAVLEVLYSRLKPGSRPSVVKRAYRNHILLLQRRLKQAEKAARHGDKSQQADK